VVHEAPLEPTETGFVQAGPGWFVVSARGARWRYAEGRGSVCPFGDEEEFSQVGVNLFVLASGEPMGMYHWEADQEDFLVLAGEGLLIVEGEERQLRRWDFVHCQAGTRHVIIGAGDGPCVVLAVGARQHQGSPDWGGYTVEEAALRYAAGVEQETTDPWKAYANVPHRQPSKFQDGWLPGSEDSGPHRQSQSPAA
jgi:uncharacterized cupin superfamily protein